MTHHIHILKGCAPTPLANYLKALGILRLVGEQVDSQARGWWDGERFCLMTKLSREELEGFFLGTYEPTPLLSPWNKGCGFFKANDPGLHPLEHSISNRFKPFRDGVRVARNLLGEIEGADVVIRAIKARTKTNNSFQNETQRHRLVSSELYRSFIRNSENHLSRPELPVEESEETRRDLDLIISLGKDPERRLTKTEAEALKNHPAYKRILAAAERKFKSLKLTLIPDCKRIWRGGHADWMSAAVSLNENGEPSWPSLLGTGGNDGNLDFTNNFMQQLGRLFDLASGDGLPNEATTALLGNALWGLPDNHLSSGAIGQYQPGSAGGANSSTGFLDGNLVNAWDFILMMEGSVLFASRATKRLDPTAFSRMSAPFAIRSHATGFASSGNEKSQRGEQWMPLWGQAATLEEFRNLLGESRIQFGVRVANRPIDAVRAISRLGVARGIGTFVRYGYLERNGQSTLAVPLGNIQVRQRPLAYLMDDFSSWLDRIGRECRSGNAPARLVQAEKRLSDFTLSALTHDSSASRWQSLLLAAINIEEIQATGTAVQAGPLPSLNIDWISAVDDGSVEFRLALALGSAAADYTKDGRPVEPIRHHVLPLESGMRRFQVREKRLVSDPRVVVSGRDPLRDLTAIVERRLVEAGMKGHRRLRLVAPHGCGARLDDLANFISGAVDLDKLVRLARAFMAIRWKDWRGKSAHLKKASNEMPVDGWLAVRLACLPWQLTTDLDIPADPRLSRLLSSGDAERAIDIATKRLSSVGICTPLQFGFTDSLSAMRWAAALVFPISKSIACHCAKRLDPRLNFKKGN